MVAEQVLTCGLVERTAWSVVSERQCRWQRQAALGADELSRVDLVTRDLDVYRINAVVENFRQELGVCRDP